MSPNFESKISKKNHICHDNQCRHFCTGCGMCSAICPVNAIEMKLSVDGFYTPVVSEEACISCGICKKVCYKYDNLFFDKKTHRPLKCLSAVNRNENELKTASSGAVSVELMRRCLQLGYYIVGVGYDYRRDIAVTKIAKNEKEILSFKGSKYFQSYTESAFRRICQDNTEQKYAVFGTPCQIYAFSQMTAIKQNRERFLLVDIFCHGCPSINLWKKYIAEKKQQHQVTENFDHISFRSKVYGWHEYAFDFYKKPKRYFSDKYNDSFYEIFFGMDIMNEACYDCISRNSVEKTDIRLGDFWGWQYDTDIKGVSAVVLNTEKGVQIFESISNKFRITKFNFEDIVAAQSYGKIYSYNKKRRFLLLELLKSKEDLNDIQYKYRKQYPFRRQIKRKLKNILKHIPAKYYNKLRQCSHRIGIQVKE